AALAADTATMRLLLAHGADVTLGSKDNITPVMVAAGKARSDDESSAPESRQLEAVQLMLELGADINARDSVGDTPLPAATYAGPNTVVEYLVTHGAAINAKNNVGLTP